MSFTKVVHNPHSPASIVTSSVVLAKFSWLASSVVQDTA